MHTLARSAPVSYFARPTLPAASCLHFIRHFQPITRGELVQYTGKSQPTVTRAVAALLDAQLIRERNDLAIVQGPGRPKIPLVLAPSPFVQVGVAIGTHTTYVGAYSIRGNALQEQLVHTTAAKQSPEQFIATIADAIRHVAAATNLRLASIGVSTSGTIGRFGYVNAPNLGWRGVPLHELLSTHFDVPLSVSTAIQAIAGAELQSQTPDEPHTTLVLHSDDSIGAALADAKEVRTLEVERSSLLEASIQLVRSYTPSAVVLAGDTFGSKAEARLFHQSLLQEAAQPVQVRIYPAHLENARAAARAVAMERLMHDPLELA
ncbi:ROK family transcriptional regulator [Corynebacterium gerontici]|uniref:ROK family protein n=1 Tax=Corynebacterium gerontici TaxID=2079234 RepID=A0A3G6J2R4_9CORY|nr:ROK family transcriptional regulator [Corynebacterium gerontici]AZA10394.1 ROK family protein [Corynebacterium gerontici]